MFTYGQVVVATRARGGWPGAVSRRKEQVKYDLFHSGDVRT